MGRFTGGTGQRPWSLTDTYDFISTFLAKQRPNRGSRPRLKNSATLHSQLYTSCAYSPKIALCHNRKRQWTRSLHTLASTSSSSALVHNFHQRRCFHDYFVTHLPSSSLHPDSRSSSGPHHKLPRSASTPHTLGRGAAPAAAPPSIGASRDLTVVRIPLRSAKHHFGVSVSRGTRPYNEDTYQAGTIEVPAFAKRAPISLSRRPAGKASGNGVEATSAESASGDPQVFFFAVYDGHGGHECSDFLREELHFYIEEAAELFELGSSLKKMEKKEAINETGGTPESDLSAQGRESLAAIDVKSEEDVKDQANIPERSQSGKLGTTEVDEAKESEDPVSQQASKPKALDLETSLVQQWSDTVGGYFRRFKPEFFDLPAIRSRSRPGSASSTAPEPTSSTPISMETILMYSFLRADLDFVTAQASKPESDAASDAPLNNDEILGRPSHSRHSPTNATITGPRLAHNRRIGGPNRFKGGSTASIAMISTPTPTPFWHPASPSTLLVAHVGDTRILLCETSTGLAIPATTNHHPSSPIEGSRLRRYAATFVTDSFGEERMSGLANTRAFGDMRSKRIGVSAEPELRRYELGPAQYSFLVLVSDGVSGTLSDQEIVDVVKEAKTPEQGARDVVSFATEVSREGDNATCLVVRLGGWERRAEGGMGSLGTKEVRDFRRAEGDDPRSRRT